MAFTAAPSTSTNLEASLKRLYEPEYFEVHTNENAPYYAMLKKMKNVEIRGEGMYWPFHLALPETMGWLPENGAFAPVKPRSEIQARMRAKQLGESLRISVILEAIGQAGGSFDKNEVQRHIKACVMQSTKHINRTFAGTEGTGRLGQIEANTTTSDTFVMKKPLGAWLIKPRMLLDVYDARTGGAISTVADDATQLFVKSVNYQTRTVVVSQTDETTAVSLSLVADEHVYNYPDYRNAANGLLGLVDDGTFEPTIHNQSRTTYPVLKSYVSSNAGVGRPLSEELLEDMIALVRQNSGKNIANLVANSVQRRH